MENPSTANRQGRNGCRLVLFPLPFQGHINPMIQLAKILHSRGFSISIFHTRYNFPDPSNYPHFTFHLISDGLSELEASTLDALRIIKLLLANCVEPFEQCLAQILSSDDSNYRVGCVVSDALWYFTQAAADKFKIPRIVLRTSSICSFLAFSALPLLRERYLSYMDSRMEAAVLELPPIKVKDIPRLERHDGEDMYRAIENMVRETKKASGLVFNTFQELEEPELAKLQEQFLKPTFTIGPFHKRFSAASTSLFTQDGSSISWLDARAPRSVLYLSFGSIAAMDQQKLNEMAWGLADSMQPFLWVVRPGLVRDSEWLAVLPNEFLEATRDRGYIVKWAPQQEVLSHPAVGGFWTHSGWNSTLESICEGVPMICSPFFGDQMVNSRYVSDVWRIGIRLEKGLERGEIRDAVRRVMVERDGEEMRQRVMCLKEKAGFCLNSGGSSYQALDALVNFITSFTSPD
ncbi:UNVERIFIED_CONTAM: UDP-glycosyltransferase 76F1 [Sesamum radiatum]|uniref:UDP-glycosyltransferase 76F1 n=1 Tax=Sesamum radiatum TaxID=300843 RepID=A0AAW2NFT6_SESRA